MNVDIIGKFYLGNGGIGDFLLLLSTFYDDIPEDQKANVIFLANDLDKIKELYKLFPKLGKVLIVQNDWQLLHELFTNKSCVGTGILPQNLHYPQWSKVNIFKDYKVKEFPEFTKLIKAEKIADKSHKQLFIQAEGSKVEGSSKIRKISDKELELIYDKYHDWLILDSKEFSSIKETLEFIKGSDLVIGCDSFAKTWSAMCGIKTIVYDNVYNNNYLDNFINKTDAGHYVFIYPWCRIEFITQEESHRLSYKKFRDEL